MEKIKFNLELVKEGYTVSNYNQRSVIIYDVDLSSVCCPLKCVIDPLGDSFFYACDLEGRAYGMDSNFNLFCVAPQANSEVVINHIPFNLEEAKAGKPIAFIDEAKYGVIKRVVDWKLNTTFDKRLDEAAIIIAKRDADEFESIYVVTLHREPLTEHELCASTHLRMLPTKKFIALFRTEIDPEDLQNLEDSECEYKYFIDHNLYTEKQIKSKVRLGKLKGGTKFMGYFPVTD